MIATKDEHINADSFNKYDDARIDYFEMNDNGIICHYIKNGKNFSFGGNDWTAIKAQWNYRMI